MNKKLLIAIIGVAVLVAAVVTALVIGGQQAGAPNADTTGEISESSYKIVKACDILTLDEAKTLLGDSAKAGSNTEPVTNESLSIDTCSYTNSATTVADIRIITVSTRSALDGAGQESNVAAFEPGGEAITDFAESVEGYGDKAYWDGSTGQLAILDGSVWISIVYGSTNPLNNSLEEAEQVAKLLN